MEPGRAGDNQGLRRRIPRPGQRAGNSQHGALHGPRREVRLPRGAGTLPQPGTEPGDLPPPEPEKQESPAGAPKTTRDLREDGTAGLRHALPPGEPKSLHPDTPGPAPARVHGKNQTDADGTVEPALHDDRVTDDGRHDQDQLDRSHLQSLDWMPSGQPGLRQLLRGDADQTPRVDPMGSQAGKGSGPLAAYWRETPGMGPPRRRGETAGAGLLREPGRRLRQPGAGGGKRRPMATRQEHSPTWTGSSSPNGRRTSTNFFQKTGTADIPTCGWESAPSSRRSTTVGGPSWRGTPRHPPVHLLRAGVGAAEPERDTERNRTG